MPSPLHQGLLFLLKSNPHLVFELARNFDAQFRDDYRQYEVASNELPDPANEGNILHADWAVAALADPALCAPALRAPTKDPERVAGVAVEVQTTDDLLKYYSWLSYCAGVRRLFKCRGWTIVFAPDPGVRRRAQNMYATEPRASPWFVEPTMLPPILDIGHAAEDLDKAALTAVFHARTPHGVAGVRATLEGLQEVAHNHRRVYVDLMRASLTEPQLEQIPAPLFDIDDDAPLGPMELTSGYYTRGHREGLEQGRLVEARRSVQRVLNRRGLTLDELQRRRIEACEDLARLEQWLEHAVVAVNAAELFG